jgi:tetratricopeptide (TPR) repeat protein
VIDLRQKLAEIERKRKVSSPSRIPGKKVLLGVAATIAGFILLGSIAIFGNHYMTNDELINKYGISFEGVYASRSTTDNVNDDYTKGVDYYNIHDFENARRYFSKIIKADPENMASTMYCGTSNFELKNYPTASEMFNKIINNNDNLFIEDAELYLALCYIQTDDNKKAIDLLKQIKDSRSIYRKDAANILRHIKK